MNGASRWLDDAAGKAATSPAAQSAAASVRRNRCFRSMAVSRKAMRVAERPVSPGNTGDGRRPWGALREFVAGGCKGRVARGRVANLTPRVWGQVPAAGPAPAPSARSGSSACVPTGAGLGIEPDPVPEVLQEPGHPRDAGFVVPRPTSTAPPCQLRCGSTMRNDPMQAFVAEHASSRWPGSLDSARRNRDQTAVVAGSDVGWIRSIPVRLQEHRFVGRDASRECELGDVFRPVCAE